MTFRDHQPILIAVLHAPAQLVRAAAAPHFDKDKPHVRPVLYVGFSNRDKTAPEAERDKINRPVSQVWYFTSWRWERQGEHGTLSTGKCYCKDAECGQLGFYDLADADDAHNLKSDFDLRMALLEAILAKKEARQAKAREYRAKRALKA